jgi:uncharacterized metal-binding protein YceD (DUF177 family)
MMKDHNIPAEKPPFSYPVKVGNISANAVTVRMEASPSELKGVAELWNVVEVKALKAEVYLSRWKKDGVRMKGRVSAEIVQSCVVTLEPVESRIDEPFEQIFVPEGSKLARIIADDAAEMVLDPDGPDAPEAFVGDEIDVGEAVTEFAALAIDPYPRAEGVDFADHVESDESTKSGKPNPFAVLKDWKKD